MELNGAVLECKGLCHDSCTIVAMTAEEIARLSMAAGRDFEVFPMPVIDGAHTLTIVDHKRPPYRCPALTKDGRCSGYEGRPMICRLYGLIESLPCSHGCKPSRYLTMAEADALLFGEEGDSWTPYRKAARLLGYEAQVLRKAIGGGT